MKTIPNIKVNLLASFFTVERSSRTYGNCDQNVWPILLAWHNLEEKCSM